MGLTHIIPQDPMVEFIVSTDRINHPGLQFRVIDFRKFGWIVGLDVGFVFSRPGLSYFSFFSSCYRVLRCG